MKTATRPTIAQRLTDHLNGDGTANDSTTDAFYREFYRINPDAETDLEDVERWAFRVQVNHSATPPTP